MEIDLRRTNRREEGVEVGPDIVKLALLVALVDVDPCVPKVLDVRDVLELVVTPLPLLELRVVELSATRSGWQLQL